VNEVVTALENVYDEVSADAVPPSSHCALGAPGHVDRGIVSQRRGRARRARVLRLLHPTSAVGGVPRQSAYELIRRLEQIDRATTPDRWVGSTPTETANGGSAFVAYS